MGKWSSDSKSHVAFMPEGDFYGSEKSVVIPEAGNVKIVLTNKSGETVTLKESVSLEKNEVIDSSVMSVGALREFFEAEIQDAKATGVMVITALKSDHDEDKRSCNVWSCSDCLL